MKKIIVLMCVLFFLAACASEDKRGPSEDVLLTEQATEVIEKARQTYVKNDIKGLKAFFTEDGYKMMVRDVKKFDSVELKFSTRWVDIKQDGSMYIKVAWQGTWKLREDWTEERDGMVTFVLSGKPLKISGLKMTSPFGQPDITSPGKKQF